MKNQLALSLLAVLFLTPLAQAANITASEYIIDAFDGDQRDFERNRLSSSGTNNFEFDDALIIAENALSDSFGVIGVADVSYSHDLTWLIPMRKIFSLQH